MPETRYVDVYDGEGHLVDREPFEVSDEQLHMEALAAEANDKSHQGLDALNNWQNLSKAQKDTVVKHMLWFLLYREGLL